MIILAPIQVGVVAWLLNSASSNWGDLRKECPVLLTKPLFGYVVCVFVVDFNYLAVIRGTFFLSICRWAQRHICWRHWCVVYFGNAVTANAGVCSAIYHVQCYMLCNCVPRRVQHGMPRGHSGHGCVRNAWH